MWEIIGNFYGIFVVMVLGNGKVVLILNVMELVVNVVFVLDDEVVFEFVV